MEIGTSASAAGNAHKTSSPNDCQSSARGSGGTRSLAGLASKVRSFKGCKENEHNEACHFSLRRVALSDWNVKMI
jgi:hypothetical protein